MAKDGTRRGGARAGAGRKPKALTDKINEGISATIIELPETPTMEGVDVPPVKDYLKTKQKSGKDLCAAEVVGLSSKVCKFFFTPLSAA